MFRKTILSTSLALLVSLLDSSASAQAPAQNGSPLSGAPSVAITQVQNLGVIGDDATLVIETNWTAQAPASTTLVRFNLLVTITYSDGSTNEASASVPGSERKARVRVLNKGAITPASFFAKLGTKFRRVDSLLVTREFGQILPQTNAAPPLGQTAANSSGNSFEPGVDITKLERASLCAPSKECVDVMWAIIPRRQDPNPENRTEIEGFTVRVEATYGDGTKKNGLKPAGAQSREASVQIDRHAPSAGSPAQAGQISRFKVSLITRFSFPEFRTDTKQGNF